LIVGSSVADVLAPPNEEGTRATVLRWCKLVGDQVRKDEPLVELETDKVTVEVPAPASGTLIEVLKQVNAEVTPDEVLARLSLAGESAPQTVSSETAAPMATAENAPAAKAMPAGHADLSPAVRRLLSEHAIAPGDIKGTGRGGRITADDVARHVDKSGGSPQPQDMRIAHTAIRRRVAKHMVRSLADAPHVTTLFEADMTRVLKHRSLHAADYESRGTRLTLTAYFISACGQALCEHPQVNATFHEDALQLHAEVNIGVGTALGSQGLIVPVIHSAQALSLFAIAKRLNQLVDSARAGTLAPEDVRGGTFTISNHGVGGSLLAAPIVINQPQVAILGIGKLQRRVCVVQAAGDESIAVRSMCYLTLTIDHRALDAFQANAFLSAVVSALERWPEEEGL
jgi:2-oxoglutarate dehydrogenase E2 component (dihydrolipoamide succinyltransferase)